MSDDAASAHPFAPFKLTAALGGLLYVMGAARWAGYLGTYGVSLSLVDMPLYRLLMPTIPAAAILLQAAMWYSEVHGFGSFKPTNGEPGPPAERVSGRWLLGLWVIAMVAMSIAGKWQPTVAGLVGGSVAGILFVLAGDRVRFPSPTRRLQFLWLAVGVCMGAAGVVGTLEAKNADLDWVKYETTRGGSGEGLLIEGDGRSWFIWESEAKALRVIPAGRIEHVEYVRAKK